jgi:predicted O-methyltransferase YrrM
MNEIPYTPLCALAEKHGTDKRPEPLGHGYTHYYHSLFANRREHIRKVLEIGIDVGASLRMWRDYFPNALITGLDCDENKLFSDERIECLHCDQSSIPSLLDTTFRVGEGFDFILDDGSHEAQHQIDSARTFVPLLSPSGIYVIEDVLEPRSITPHLPYAVHIEYFKVERDPWSKLMVIHATH